jgi:hypothetical protein
MYYGRGSPLVLPVRVAAQPLALGQGAARLRCRQRHSVEAAGGVLLLLQGGVLGRLSLDESVLGSRLATWHTAGLGEFLPGLLVVRVELLGL